ncbi:MAG: cupin domain-containing protein [Flavobacteriales bacterium]|nr:cupin domain-containing protein [Flavobacteriales bacterium]
MNRKQFMKASGAGLGMAMIPGIMKGAGTLISNNEKLPAKVIRDQEGEVLDVIGDVQTHKLLGSDTGNQLVEWVDNVAPGVGIPPHVHTKEDEIFRVVRGQIEITIDGSTTLLEEGDVAFAPKNIPHAWKVVGTEKAKMITTAFPAGIEMMFSELAALPAGPPDFGKVAEICGKHGISFV